jgi:activator of HSP90 ATPase
VVINLSFLFPIIGQKWRLKSWPQNHFSEVTISIKQTKDDTKLSIKQKKVPIREMENTRQGWHRYYFQAIKQSFGFGASLF